MRCAYCSRNLTRNDFECGPGHFVVVESVAVYLCGPSCSKAFVEANGISLDVESRGFDFRRLFVTEYRSSKKSALARGFDIFCQALRDMFADIAKFFK